MMPDQVKPGHVVGPRPGWRLGRGRPNRGRSLRPLRVQAPEPPPATAA